MKRWNRNTYRYLIRSWRYYSCPCPWREASYVSELRPLTGLLFITQMIYDYRKSQWNDIDRGKLKISEKDLSQFHFVKHKFHTDWPGRDPGPPRWETCGDDDCDDARNESNKGMNLLYSKSNAVNLKQGQRNVFIFGSYVYKDQRDPTGGPQVISGPKLLVIRPAKLFVNLFLFTTSLFIFFTLKDLKKKVSRFLSCLLLYVQMPHTVHALKTL
jgi:hypothetical protein